VDSYGSRGIAEPFVSASWRRRRCSCNPHLKPALEEAIAQFPLKILGFHSDNGSEFINHGVARLLNKLRIQQTKSLQLTPSANIVFEFAIAHTEVPPMVKAFFLSKEWMWRAYGGATLILGLLFNTFAKICELERASVVDLS
jgi:hypothetical protein